MSETTSRTIDIPVDDGHTVQVLGTFCDGQLDGINLNLRPDDRQEHGENGKQQDVSIGQLENIEAVIRAMASMLPAAARERVAQPKPHGDRDEWTHFTVGREFVAIHALLEGAGIDPRNPFTYPCGEAVQELVTSAIGRLDGALKETRPDDHEIHLAKALLAATAMFALIGYASYALQPDGCSNGGPSENPDTPEEVEARWYASLLCDIARERWPAKRWWYTPPDELAAEREEGEA